MPRPLNLPDSASVADSHEDGRMFAPSAARNAAAILEVLQRIAPPAGTVLEIASGTGEHVLRFAKAMPGLIWQPSEVDDTRIASIRAWTHECDNILDPLRLDATVAGWSQDHYPPTMIFLSNLLHLISETEAQTLVLEAARALAPGGIFLIYGPFRRGTTFASDGDQGFHAELIAQDPAIGYKAFETVQTWLSEGGLDDLGVIQMPANNLILTAQRPS